MAEATVVTGPRVHNYGDQTAITARLNIATTGDVWTHGLRAVEAIITPPRTNLTDVALNAGGTAVVFTIGGALTNIDITVVGYP